MSVSCVVGDWGRTVGRVVHVGISSAKGCVMYAVCDVCGQALSRGDRSVCASFAHQWLLSLFLVCSFLLGGRALYW